MGDEASSIGFSDPYVVLLEDALGPMTRLILATNQIASSIV